VKKKYLVVPGLLLALMLVGAGLQTRAASPAPEPPRPRPFHRELEEFPFLAPEPADPELQVQEGVAAASFVPWSKLVFQSYRDGDWNLYLANGDGSDQTRATAHRAHDIHPRLNRGSARIVFSASRADNYDIYVTNPGLTQLTSDPADDVNPFWSPDGTKIAFQSYRDGQSEIYVMNADGSSQTRLTWDGAYDGDPAWSPDGSKLAFTSNRTGGYRIWVMNADGSGQVQLSNQAYSENPVWSPDGSQIAYNSDGDGDDWQELWLMNADGSDQREVYDPGGTRTDAWAGSWSSDGRYVAFTQITFVYYKGDWYWTTAYLDAWDSMNPWNSPTRLSDQGTDWNPDWQTTDAEIPTSQMRALPPQSPGPFAVNWSGSDTGSSGFRNYDVQVRDGAGDWADWQMGTAATSASYPGIGGHTYYFRVRARDNSYNLEPWPPDYDASTTVEALPPATVVRQLPAYSRVGVLVSWGGGDPGGSGIQTYDVQYREGKTGSWTDWLMGTTDASATFSGTPGQIYYFRSRAADNAQNVESWSSGDGDAYTTLYTWGMSGVVQDNTGVPVAGANITTTPDALAAFPSDNEGNLAAYVATEASAYTVAWMKDGYGNLPATDFNSAQDKYLNIFLPPADNIVRNGDFESGDPGTGDWLATGVTTPMVTDSLKHTGNYAALLGQEFTFAPPLNLSNSPGSSQYPQIAVDESGTVHIAWEESEYPYKTYYTQRKSDGTWSTPQSIVENLEEIYPILTVDSMGIVHILWRGYMPEGSYEIFHVWRDTSGVWSSPHNISNTSGESLLLYVAAADNGVIHVVWIDSTSGQDELYYAWRELDGTWSTPQSISGAFNVEYSAQLAVDKDNAVHVVWLSGEWWPSDWNFYYARRDSNGTWSSPQLCASLNDHAEPHMVVDGNGNVHLVWNDFKYLMDDDIFYTQRNNAGVWSEPVELSGALDGYWPDIAVGENGDVHVVWGGNPIGHIWRKSSGGWSSPYTVFESHGDNISPRVAVDGNGIAHVAWGDRPSDLSWRWEIYYSRWGPDSGWGNPQFVSDADFSSSSMALGMATSRNGIAHMAWIDGSDGNWEIMYAGPKLVAQSGDSTISQLVTVPITMSTPVLSFLEQSGGAFATSDSCFNVQVSDGITITTFLSTPSDAGWSHHWLDLAPWSGQTITLTFNVYQEAGDFPSWTYLDEVTIGSAYPDLWVGKSNVAALPGEQVVYRITYGNRGSTGISGVWITHTLPGELSFVNASSLPITATTSSLVWDVGDLSAKSGPFNIVVTATVASTATVLNSFTATVHIGANSPELEKANNVAQTVVFVGRRIYMPLIFKGYAE
jgi:uncharacterized repeat protein (TIGR01451 family)